MVRFYFYNIMLILLYISNNVKRISLPNICNQYNLDNNNNNDYYFKLVFSENFNDKCIWIIAD